MNQTPPKQPWLHSPGVDLLFVLFPPFACLAAIALFPGFFQETTDMPLAAWVILVVLIDVSHVYSTLFRTYLDQETFRRQKQLMIWVPVLAWLAGMLLYAVSDLFFWRVLAYLAVFHFIRQQYGFLQLYSRKESQSKISRRINVVTIYAATLYPILYWHLEGQRQFNWFMPGDFLTVSYPDLLPVLKGLYLVVVGVYLVKEINLVYRQKTINLPRNLVVAGTLLSWYLGIVYYNGDLIYTTFNVVSHGIPYLALVWIYGRKKHLGTAGQVREGSRLRWLVFRNAGVLVFLAFLAALAYVEEGFWDALVWREHSQAFGVFSSLPQLQDKLWLAMLVPLLALPQVTHYVLDGFIWKVSRDTTLQGRQQQ